MPLALLDALCSIAWTLGHRRTRILTKLVTPAVLIFSFSFVRRFLFPPLQQLSKWPAPLPTSPSSRHRSCPAPLQGPELAEACSLLPYSPVFRSGTLLLCDPYLPHCLSRCGCHHSSTVPRAGSKGTVPSLTSLSPTLKSCHPRISLVSNAMHESDISFLLFHLCRTQELVSNDTEAKS